ncbi:MAG: hypothetical protein U1F24_13670 [Alphaproteobacteria bacterium]|jgi:hypothetical protein
MLSFSRFAAVSVFALGLMAFQDPAGRFTIDFPEGWTEMPPQGEGIHAVQAPAELGKVVCNAQSPDMPGLVGMTQDAINAEMSAPMDTAGWANILGVDAALVEVHKAEALPIDGKYLQFATLTMKAGAFAPVDVKAVMGVFVLPGRLVNAGCYAPMDAFDKVKDVFEKTVSSVRPL